MIENRRVAIVYRSLCFLIILAGLLKHLGVFAGTFRFKSLMYYTTQSNLFALFVFGLLAFKTVKAYQIELKHGQTGYYPRFEMICVVDIFLTLLVYWIILVPTGYQTSHGISLWSFENLSIHLLSPVLCFVDYIIFAKSQHLKYHDVYLTLVFPVFYLAMSSVAGFAGYIYRLSPSGNPIHYPYFFLNYKDSGIRSIFYIGILLIVLLVVSHIFYAVDRYWKKPQINI